MNGRLKNKSNGFITCNPEIMDGLPVIKGTRIPVYVILEHLEAGLRDKEILKEYPVLKEKHIKAALDFASRAVSKPLLKV